MKIGICDDEPIIANALKQLVKHVVEKRNIDAEIIVFLTGESLLEIIEEFDIVFLDVEMPEMDGYEVGKQINKRNTGCKIIMATGNTARYKESLKISAFRYVTKPFEYVEINEAIDDVITSKIGEESIELYFNRTLYRIQQKNIKYFRAFNSYIEAKIEDEFFRREVSLNEIEELIDERLFVRIHRKYIVNLLYVIELKNGNVKIDGISLPVSTRKIKEYEKKYVYFSVTFSG